MRSETWLADCAIVTITGGMALSEAEEVACCCDLKKFSVVARDASIGDIEIAFEDKLGCSAQRAFAEVADKGGTHARHACRAQLRLDNAHRGGASVLMMPLQAGTLWR